MRLILWVVGARGLVHMNNHYRMLLNSLVYLVTIVVNSTQLCWKQCMHLWKVWLSCVDCISLYHCRPELLMQANNLVTHAARKVATSEHNLASTLLKTEMMTVGVETVSAAS